MYYKCVDELGNESEAIRSDVHIDMTSPIISFKATGETGKKNWYKTLTMNIDINEMLISTVKYCETNGTTCAPNMELDTSKQSYQIPMSEGRTQKICVYANDTAGNETTSCSESYKIDNTPPIAVLKGSTKFNDVVLDASASSDATSGIVSYSYTMDGQTWYNSETPTYTIVGFSDGTANFALNVEDEAGNVSAVPGSLTLLIVANTIYVSSLGSDTTGTGLISNPVATIQKAYEKVKNGGNIKILNNINMAKNVTVTDRSVTISSNDSPVTVSRTTANEVLRITNTTVNLENIIFDGQNLSLNDPFIYLHTSSTLNLNKGSVIQKMKHDGWAGAIYVMTDAKLNINGGSLKNNYSNTGGASVLSNGDTIMNSGVISGDSGINGSIFVANGGSFTLNNGEISNNTFNNGTIFLGQGTVTINDGNIHDNTATLNGSAIYNQAGTLNIIGGTIEKNHGAYGAVFAGDNSTATLSGGEIKNNTASDGAGIYNRGTLNITGTHITNNEASNSGGGIFNVATITFSSGLIQANKAKYGAGVYLVDNSKFTFNGESSFIVENTASVLGGGIYINKNSIYQYVSGNMWGNQPEQTYQVP